MTRFGWLVLLGIIVVLAAIGGGVWYLHASKALAPATVDMATTTSQDPTTLSIYTNGEYGFSFFYPSEDALVDASTASDTPDFPWRETSTASGSPVVSVTDVAGTVHVGASKDSKAVAACLKPANGEKAQADLQLASTTFSAFTFDRLGTDAPKRIESYRAVHEDACVALEMVTPEDGPTGDAVSRIVQSFSFARP